MAGKSGIKIKPSKVGTLRAATKTPKGKNIPVATLEAKKNSPDPAMRKKANFALNARKWGR
jgi:hypothetical protein